MLVPHAIEKSGKGHREIPPGGGKSEVWEAFTGLPLSILDILSKDQNETDARILQKLSAGLDKAARILNEIRELHATSARKESYYSEWWQKKCDQWTHEAKLKVIWDSDPHLPLFGASEILAGRDPYDPANEFSPDAARANASRNEAAARRYSGPSRKESDSGYDEAPWAHQARMDAIEANNYRIWKAGLHDYYHGANSPRYECVKPKY